MSRLPIVAVIVLGCGGPIDGGEAPDGGTHPADAAETSSGFALTSEEGGLVYTAGLTVGMQQFSVVVDTGSTTLGIAGSTCSNCGVTPEYTPGTGAVDQHTTSMATYGDDSMWSGENYSDKVAITGDSDAVTMDFAVMSSQTNFFQQGEGDEGILGLAGSGLAITGTDSYIAKREPSQFSFQLCPDDGTLWLGVPPDSSHESAAAQFSPMDTSEPYYMIDVTSASIGSASIGLTGAAVMDTGTSIMVLSTTVANKMIAAIKAGGYSTIFGTQTLSASASLECLDPGAHTRAEIDAALPGLSVVLPKTGGGSFTVTVPPSLSYLMPVEGMYCFGVASVSGLPTILGDAFLRAFITTFDLQNKQIGLAPQAGCTLPLEARPDHPVQHKPWRIRGRHVPATD